MKPIEVVIVIAAAALVIGVTVSGIIRRKKGKTGCDCGCSDCPCHGSCSSARKKEETPGKKG